MSASPESDGRGVGLLLAVMSAVGFSFKAVLVKLAYPYGVDAVTLLALRMGFALPFFLVLGCTDSRRRPARWTSRDVGQLLALGFFGYYLASILDFAGLQHISASLERIVLFSYPALVVLLSSIVLRKPIRARILVALLLCTAGILLAMSHDLRTFGEANEVTRGVLLVLGASLSYAIYLMGNGEIVVRLGSARVTSTATSVAAVCCLVQFGVTHPLSALALPWQVYALSLAMALFCTVLPAWWVSEAIRRLGASHVSMIGTLGPVITIGLGWAILGDPLGVTQIGGAALVVAGVVTVARDRR